MHRDRTSRAEGLIADRRIRPAGIAPVKVYLWIGARQGESFEIHPFVVIGAHAAAEAEAEGAKRITPYWRTLKTGGEINPTELVATLINQEESFAISGGFMEVQPDRVTVLDQGKILFIGTIAELRNSPSERIQNLLNRRPEDDSVDLDAYLTRLTGESVTGDVKR